VSKTTVREAIRSLEQLHFVEVKQGKGIYLAVDPQSLGKNIAQLKSVTEMAQESGINLQTLSWEVQEMQADFFLSEKFGVPMGTPLVLVTRVRGFDDEVAVYLEDLLLKELVADFTPLDWQGSLFEALEKRGIFVSHSVAQIIPYVPEGKIKEKL
ncbi:MAG: GntR family transcriptional regulator, partial [Candidatus Caldatribacteriaceae bacterium]